jgi:hypothetical protein
VDAANLPPTPVTRPPGRVAAFLGHDLAYSFFRTIPSICGN